MSCKLLSGHSGSLRGFISDLWVGFQGCWRSLRCPWEGAGTVGDSRGPRDPRAAVGHHVEHVIHGSVQAPLFLNGSVNGNYKSILIRDADFHCPFYTRVLGTRHCQSLTTGKMWTCELLRKRKWKLKIAFAVESDPAVCALLAWRQVLVSRNNSQYRASAEGPGCLSHLNSLFFLGSGTCFDPDVSGSWIIQLRDRRMCWLI